MSKLATFKLATPKLAVPKLATAKLATSRLATSSRAISRIAMSRLATTGGALCLCIISVVAWHRIEGIPSSQAHNQPRLQPINMTVPPHSPHVAKPAAAIAESPAAIAPPAAVQPLAAPKAAIVPASINTVIPTSIPTPKRAIRVHDAALAPNLPLSGQDSGIQASRAPLHFAYPVNPDANARGGSRFLDGAGGFRRRREHRESRRGQPCARRGRQSAPFANGATVPTSRMAGPSRQKPTSSFHLSQTTRFP